MTKSQQILLKLNYPRVWLIHTTIRFLSDNFGYEFNYKLSDLFTKDEAWAAVRSILKSFPIVKTAIAFWLSFTDGVFNTLFIVFMTKFLTAKPIYKLIARATHKLRYKRFEDFIKDVNSTLKQKLIACFKASFSDPKTLITSLSMGLAPAISEEGSKLISIKAGLPLSYFIVFNITEFSEYVAKIIGTHAGVTKELIKQSNVLAKLSKEIGKEASMKLTKQIVHFVFRLQSELKRIVKKRGYDFKASNPKDVLVLVSILSKSDKEIVKYAFLMRTVAVLMHAIATLLHLKNKTFLAQALHFTYNFLFATVVGCVTDSVSGIEFIKKLLQKGVSNE